MAWYLLENQVCQHYSHSGFPLCCSEKSGDVADSPSSTLSPHNPPAASSTPAATYSRGSRTHRLPMSPHTAISEFGRKLSVYEHKEIMEYPEVWFLGLDSKKVAGDNSSTLNNGERYSSFGESVKDKTVIKYTKPVICKL